jgi:hypothetical protein
VEAKRMKISRNFVLNEKQRIENARLKALLSQVFQCLEIVDNVGHGSPYAFATSDRCQI